MEKVWLASYPPGVPAEADVAACRSIGEVFEKSVAAFGPRAAFMSMDTAISYAEMERLSRNFAAYLQTVLKLPRGARVALMMPNVLQYPIALFGALRAGYTVVNCNPLYTPRELKHQLVDSGAAAIVVVENFASVVEQVIADVAVAHVVVTGLGDMLSFAKGAAVNFAVRYVRRLAPAWRLPGAVRFKTALRRGARRAVRARGGRPRRSGVPAIYRGNHRTAQGRDAQSRKHRRQPAAGLCVVAAGPHRRAGNSRHGAAAVSYFRVDGELLDVREDRRDQPADHQSARHSRLREGAGAPSVHGA